MSRKWWFIMGYFMMGVAFVLGVWNGVDAIREIRDGESVGTWLVSLVLSVWMFYITYDVWRTAGAKRAAISRL